WALLHAWFITALNAWVVVSLSHHNPDVITFVSQSWPVRYMFNLIQLGITTAAVVFYFYVLEEKAKEQRKDDAEKLAKETELIKLRQQLQPHFLFNSLNSISALAGSKPE